MRHRPHSFTDTYLCHDTVDRELLLPRAKRARRKSKILVLIHHYERTMILMYVRTLRQV